MVLVLVLGDQYLVLVLILGDQYLILVLVLLEKYLVLNFELCKKEIARIRQSNSDGFSKINIVSNVLINISTIIYKYIHQKSLTITVF